MATHVSPVTANTVVDARAALKASLSRSGLFRTVTAADSARMMAAQRARADAEVSDSQYAKVVAALARNKVSFAEDVGALVREKTSSGSLFRTVTQATRRAV